MARLARLSLGGQLHHVIQRGHNGESIFLNTGDYTLMLDLLVENARKYAVAVHAYVLLPNHFHLLLTPRTDAALPAMLQAVGRSYVRRFNNANGRSGTLWDGRYRSTVVQAHHYLLPAMAFLDLHPVRSGLVAAPGDYLWSSHAHCIGRTHDRLLSPHALFWDLGNTPFAREAAYAELVHSGLSAHMLETLVRMCASTWALGEADFLEALQKSTARRVQKASPGRPRRPRAAP